MYLTLNGLTPFLVQQRYDKIGESKFFFSPLSFTKTSPSPSAENFTCPCSDRDCFSADLNCQCQDLCQEIKFPQPHNLSMQLARDLVTSHVLLNDIQSQIFPWNKSAIFSILTDLVIKKDKNFKYNFLKEAIRTSHKKSLSTPPKSWKSKGQGWRIVTKRLNMLKVTAAKGLHSDIQKFKMLQVIRRFQLLWKIKLTPYTETEATHTKTRLCASKGKTIRAKSRTS